MAEHIAKAHYEEKSSRAKPSVLMRLAAGFWFGTVFGLLGLGYLIYQSASRGVAISPREILYLIILPVSAGAGCGALVGGQILSSYNSAHAVGAGLRGAIIGFVCITLFIMTLALDETLYGPRNDVSQFVWLVIYISLFGGWLAVMAGTIVGALSGVALSLMNRRLRRVA